MNRTAWNKEMILSYSREGGDKNSLNSSALNGAAEKAYRCDADPVEAGKLIAAADKAARQKLEASPNQEKANAKSLLSHRAHQVIGLINTGLNRLLFMVHQAGLPADEVMYASDTRERLLSELIFLADLLSPAQTRDFQFELSERIKDVRERKEKENEEEN